MGNWRPNDWKHPYTLPEVYGVTDYDFVYEHGASNMIDARDKEWVKVIEEFEFKDGKLAMDWIDWQQVKQAMEIGL